MNAWEKKGKEEKELEGKRLSQGTSEKRGSEDSTAVDFHSHLHHFFNGTTRCSCEEEEKKRFGSKGDFSVACSFSAHD